ncbi:MAG: hypothetical protein JSS23_09165 [Proteobacteria bacterium]|nr:hypothetical protein [Pseudomonadota bacterium]
MTTALILFGTFGWLVGMSVVYGMCTGRDVQNCAQEAAGFATASGLILIIAGMLLSAI